jgi:hypothetical protein
MCLGLGDWVFHEFIYDPGKSEMRDLLKILPYFSLVDVTCFGFSVVMLGLGIILAAGRIRKNQEKQAAKPAPRR